MKTILRVCGFLLLFFTLPIFADPTPIYTEANTTITQNSNQPTFIIQLKSNRTTGYSWSLENYDEQAIQLLQHRYLPPTQMIAGAAGIEKWTFRLTKDAFATPKTFSIALVYKRPWEKDGDSRRVVFHVTVQ